MSEENPSDTLITSHVSTETEEVYSTMVWWVVDIKVDNSFLSWSPVKFRLMFW